MRISDWSSDVCSSDLRAHQFSEELQLSGEFGESKWLVGGYYFKERIRGGSQIALSGAIFGLPAGYKNGYKVNGLTNTEAAALFGQLDLAVTDRSEEHTSELQSLMRISYAVFCLKKKQQTTT